MRLVEVGTKFKFKEEKQRYTLKAISPNGRYAIMTKPLNIHKTVLYTIVDFDLGIRGPNDLIFNAYDFTKQEDIDQCMADLLSGQINISYRNQIDLNVEEANGPR